MCFMYINIGFCMFVFYYDTSGRKNRFRKRFQEIFVIIFSYH